MADDQVLAGAQPGLANGAAAGAAERYGEKVPFGVKVGYSSAMYGLTVAANSVSVLLLYFYVDVCGISPYTAGAILFAGTLIDGVGNFVASWLSARMTGPQGRYRPFLIYMSVPFGACFALMFMAPASGVFSALWWVILVHAGFRLGFSFTSMPHSALISCLSSDANERASIGSFKAFAANLGSLTTGVLGIGTIALLAYGSERRGFFWFGIIFGVLIAITVMISGIVTKENRRGGSGRGDTQAIGTALKALFSNDQAMIALVANFLFFVTYSASGAGILYYFKYVALSPDDSKYAVTAMALGGLIALPGWTWLTRRTSKRTVWVGGCALVVVAYLWLYAAGGQSPTLLVLPFLAVGAGKAAILMTYYAIIADAADYGELRSSVRTEAYAFAALALSNKFGAATGSALSAVMLAWAGLVPNMPATPEVSSRLALAICAIPLSFAVLSGLVILLFRIDAKRHRSILEALALAREDTVA